MFAVRRSREYRFMVIEEVMQQKAPVVPNNIKLHSRSKAVPTATSSSSIEESTKIGSAETKPITRNRPRTVPLHENSKSRVKRTVELLKPSVKHLDKPTVDPERPTRSKPPTPDPGGPKKPPLFRQESKSSNVVLQIVKKSHAPAKPPAPKPESILPPTLRAKSTERNLKLTKNINNNDVWTNANEVKSYRKRITSLPVVPIR
ncbi:Uncharacterized protein OBRU01_23225 [Operophtera brumata]|uniref:Uncharacterized protein n=1 Tax=Operophtera brumata TaxID=104452 RepID=A0A0L7KQ25_OPEBR|nr:Uncharacterized protein OBRU01_23225 [Operophtera brumata]